MMCERWASTYPAVQCYREYPILQRDIKAVTKKWDALKWAIETMKCTEYKRRSCGLCDGD